jgi:hypothetical protein
MTRAPPIEHSATPGLRETIGAIIIPGGRQPPSAASVRRRWSLRDRWFRTTTARVPRLGRIPRSCMRTDRTRHERGAFCGRGGNQIERPKQDTLSPAERHVSWNRPPCRYGTLGRTSLQHDRRPEEENRQIEPDGSDGSVRPRNPNEAGKFSRNSARDHLRLHRDGHLTRLYRLPVVGSSCETWADSSCCCHA